MAAPGTQAEGGLSLSTRQCSIPFSKCTRREAAQLTSSSVKKTTFDKNKIKKAERVVALSLLTKASEQSQINIDTAVKRPLVESEGP